MNDRIIEIENYWTRIVRDTAEFQQIADAENPEFNTVLKCLYNILKDGFINDLTENGAMRWEKILELPVSSTATLEERKVRILTYLSIRRPYTIRVLKQMITNLLGEDNFELSIDNDAQTLRIVMPNDVLSKLDQVKELSNRVIPQNLAVEYDSYPLPIGYTRLEYLESTGTQYIDTKVPPAGDMRILVDVMPTAWNYVNYVFGNVQRSGANIVFSLNYNGAHEKSGIYRYGTQFIYFKGNTHSLDTRYNYEFDGHKVYRNGSEPYVLNGGTINPEEFEGTNSLLLFASRHDNWNLSAAGSKKIWRFTVERKGKKVIEFIPALDPTGAPCMYDTVSKKPFYNSGSGDFVYPTEEAPAASVGLNDKFYAKRTEHGIRKLYRVPEGCTMSKDEYAAKNGFKELVEPPMPQEGYWVPEWHETETQLICEWVETEPPIEEGIENE